MIVFILFLNLFAVNIFGEAEFIFASIKLITIMGLLILAVIIILGGGPNGDRLGFRFWNDPGGESSHCSYSKSQAIASPSLSLADALSPTQL